MIHVLDGWLGSPSRIRWPLVRINEAEVQHERRQTLGNSERRRWIVRLSPAGSIRVVPADKFTPAQINAGVELWTPPALQITGQVAQAAPVEAGSADAAVELDNVVPVSGSMSLCGNQFWLGPARAGQTVRFWVDCKWVHLWIAGVRVKSLRSRFSVNDLALLVSQGAMPAGRTVVEVERTVARAGTICLGSHVLVAAEILAGGGWGSISTRAARC